jgi:hypothetical protein
LTFGKNDEFEYVDIKNECKTIKNNEYTKKLLNDILKVFAVIKKGKQKYWQSHKELFVQSFFFSFANEKHQHFVPLFFSFYIFFRSFSLLLFKLYFFLFLCLVELCLYFFLA